MLIIVCFLAVWFVNRYVWIRVGEMETAVVFHREARAFTRFLPPGRHLLSVMEQVKAVISTAPSSLKGSCTKAQTAGGILVRADWLLQYKLEPDRIQPDLRPALARALPEHGDLILRNHVNNCLQLLLSEHTVDTLAEAGSRGRLERALREAAARRLAPFGVQVFRVMILALELPTQVQAYLEAAHRQELFAQSEARVLERLQQAVSRFSAEDMEWLLQLKQLQELGQNGVMLQLPIPAFLNGQPTATNQAGNGRPRPTRSRMDAPVTGSSVNEADGQHPHWVPPH